MVARTRSQLSRIPIAPLVVLTVICLFVSPNLSINLLNNSGFENATDPFSAWAFIGEGANLITAANGSVINDTQSARIRHAGTTGKIEQTTTSFTTGVYYTASMFLNYSPVAIVSGSGAYIYITYDNGVDNHIFLTQAIFGNDLPVWGNHTYGGADNYIIYLYTNPFVIPADATALHFSAESVAPGGTPSYVIVDNLFLGSNTSENNETSLWEVRSFPFNRPNAIDYGTYILHNTTYGNINKYCIPDFFWNMQFCLLTLLNSSYQVISHYDLNAPVPQLCLAGTTLCGVKRLNYYSELGTTKKFEEGGFVLFYNGALYSRPYSEIIDRVIYAKVKSDTNTCYFWNSFTSTNRGIQIPTATSTYWGLDPMVIGSNQAFLYSPLGFECYNPSNLTITLEFWDPHTAIHLFDKQVIVPVGYKLDPVTGLPDYTQPLDCVLNATLCGTGELGGGIPPVTTPDSFDKIINDISQPKPLVLITFLIISVAAAIFGGAPIGLMAFAVCMVIGLMIGIVDFWVALLLVILDALGLAAVLSKIF